MAQDDANPKCTTCQGEGEVYKYFVNHKSKYVLFDWQYCLQCFPDSSGYWPDLDEIDTDEFDRLINEGYSDYTGR